MTLNSTDELRCTWVKSQLESLQVPLSQNNIVTLLAWSYAEGGWFYNDATYNPLDTTLQMPNSHPINSVGVQSYQSLTEGINAITHTLENGYYAAILNGLHNSTDPTVMANIIGQSPWGTSGQTITACIPQSLNLYTQARLQFFITPTKPVRLLPAPADLEKLVLPIDAMRVANLVHVQNTFQQKVAQDNGWHLWYYAVDHKFYPVIGTIPSHLVLFVNRNWAKPLGGK